MKVRAAVAATAAALALAGCGDDGGGGEDLDAPPAEIVAIAKRCGFGAPEAGTPPEGLIPAGMLPADAAVTRWEGDQRAAILLRSTIGEAYAKLLANAQRSGLEIAFQEIEAFDAEIEVKIDSGVARFALTTVEQCPDVTRAVVTKRA